MLTFVGRDERKASFGEALRSALVVAKKTQQDLGDHLGISQGAVSDWVRGTWEPAGPDVVFSAEAFLELEPGTLSRHLGYLPVEAVKSVATVDQSIRSDPALEPAEREMLLGAYNAAVARKRSRLGRPRKS